MKINTSISLCLLFPVMAIAATNSTVDSAQVCFTPGEDCTALLVRQIHAAKTSILVQAYSFTSEPIADALVDAKNNGVDVKIILDKSQLRERYSVYHYLLSQKIPIWIDNRVAIAHNKVMVFDQQEVSTGSFNFTSSAQKRNAENLLILTDTDLAKQYTANWYSRESKSLSFNEYKDIM